VPLTEAELAALRAAEAGRVAALEVSVDVPADTATLAQTVRAAHGNAMEALAAGRPWSAPTIRDSEQILEAALAALKERATKAEAERDEARQEREAAFDDMESADTRADRLETALREIEEQQPKTLAMIRDNGFVFEDIGNEPGNWQHLAFSIYTDLCEVDTLARAALADAGDAQ
jgi:hypothetical protein